MLARQPVPLGGHHKIIIYVSSPAYTAGGPIIVVLWRALNLAALRVRNEHPGQHQALRMLLTTFPAHVYLW